MLLSLANRFIYVAGPKTGSTTVESVLGPQCEVRLRGRKLKHIGHRAITLTFEELIHRAGLSPAEMFTFGVLRDPGDWLASWFNYRSRPKLFARESPNYTGNIEFDEFCRDVCRPEPPPHANFRAQMLRYSMSGRPSVDALLDYARLSDGFRAIAANIGVDISEQLSTTRENVSTQRRASGSDINPQMMERLREKYPEDFKFYSLVQDSPNGVLTAPFDGGRRERRDHAQSSP